MGSSSRAEFLLSSRQLALIQPELIAVDTAARITGIELHQPVILGAGREIHYNGLFVATEPVLGSDSYRRTYCDL